MTGSKPVYDAFEECLALVLTKGESIDSCLRRFPAQAEGLRPLLETALAARKALTVAPRPEFRDRARQQFLAQLRQTAGRRPGLAWNWRPAWALTLAAFLLVLVAGGGTVAASGGSMPGQPLYAVKHVAENARLALTLSATAKVDLYARLADPLVGEIVYLAGRGETGQLPPVTRDLDRYLARITELSGGVSQDAVLLSKNSDNAGGAAAPAVPLAPERTAAFSTTDAPAPSSGPIEMAAATEGVAEVASPRARLKARLAAQSADNTARLKAALTGAPLDLEPALLRAIAVSQSGYEKVLQALEDRP
jgi:hypothetical protein